MAAKTPWFDDSSETPLIAEYARKLDSFLAAIADEVVEAKELDEQEKRVVTVMREVEPLLSPEAHEKVTRLLCEVTAYDLMHARRMAGHARPKTRVRG